MKHSQVEINKIWGYTKEGRYAGSSPQHMPKIINDDESEQCISIPNDEGSSREVYARNGEDDIWKIVPYIGQD